MLSCRQNHDERTNRHLCLGVVGSRRRAICDFVGNTQFLIELYSDIGSIIAAVPIIVQALLLNGFHYRFRRIGRVLSSSTLLSAMCWATFNGRKKLGLSTLVVFLSLLFWGWLLGTVGMLLSVP